MASTTSPSTTRATVAKAQPQSRDMVAVHLGGCLSFEQMMACVEGSLQQIDRDTVMAHLAACPECSAKYTLAMGSRPAQSSGVKRWWLLLATVVIGGAAFMLTLPLDNGEPPARHNTVTKSPIPKALPVALPEVAPPAPATVPPPAIPATAPKATQSAPTVPPATTAATQATVSTKTSSQPSPAAKSPAKQPPLAVPRTPALKTVHLISASEAAAPGNSQIGSAGMSVEDGPSIAMVKPGDNAVVNSGFPLQIHFNQGGTAIDLDSVKLVCLKQPPIHLTARIKPNITATGIRIERVVLPPGSYPFQLSLADRQGRPARRDFSIKVIP